MQNRRAFDGQAQQYLPQFYDPYTLYDLPMMGIPGNHDADVFDDGSRTNPLPSLAVRTMAEARGYRQVEIRRLHPSPSRFTGIDTDLIGQLNDVFFGPQDYAMIARKAA